MRGEPNNKFIRVTAIVSGALVLALLAIATMNMHDTGLGLVIFSTIPIVFVVFTIVALIITLSVKHPKNLIVSRPTAASPQEKKSSAPPNPPSLFSQRNRNIVYVICIAILAIHFQQILFPAPIQEGLASVRSAGNGILGDSSNSFFAILVIPPILIACITFEKSRKRALLTALLLLVWLIAAL